MICYIYTVRPQKSNPRWSIHSAAQVCDSVEGVVCTFKLYQFPEQACRQLAHILPKKEGGGEGGRRKGINRWKGGYMGEVRANSE